MSNLYSIRKIVPLFPPFYISICAALLLDIKSNFKLDCASILYWFGLFSFFIACYISNQLYNRCNNNENIYMIELNDHVKSPQTYAKPERKQIYERYEKNIKMNIIVKMFQYYGIFVFGVLGLFCVIFGNIPLKDKPQEIDNQSIMSQLQIEPLQDQNDDLEVNSIEQAVELNLE